MLFKKHKRMDSNRISYWRLRELVVKDYLIGLSLAYKSSWVIPVEVGKHKNKGKCTLYRTNLPKFGDR